ncbi:MAG: hypothetical protein L6Q33_13775 [Bacteriovoracaceae bacterium]|nr:hypothetical protein [Bacteriovoracaceae bacterium]
MFHAKNRQRLLLLAIVGLILSSFALLILQSTMGGLQKKLVGRAKNIQGTAVLYLDKQKYLDESYISSLKNELFRSRLNYTIETELELLLKYKSYITPVIVHGVDVNSFLPAEFDESKKDFQGAVVPMELAYKVGVLSGDEVQLISPIFVDTFLTDIPRQITLPIIETVNFDVPEIDGFHLWVKLSKIQNLIREKSFNSVRFYSPLSKKDLGVFKEYGLLKTWEESNQSLVYALNLESSIMIFLFGAMALLVAFCISSGLLIFFNKIKLDISSFWILGMSPKKLFNSTAIFLYLLIIFSLILGLIFGTSFLILFKTYGTEILPDVFIDRKIPVYFSLKNYLVAFFLPFGISAVFIQLALNKFKQSDNHLENLRTI